MVQRVWVKEGVGSFLVDDDTIIGVSIVDASKCSSVWMDMWLQTSSMSSFSFY